MTKSLGIERVRRDGELHPHQFAALSLGGDANTQNREESHSRDTADRENRSALEVSLSTSAIGVKRDALRVETMLLKKCCGPTFDVRWRHCTTLPLK